MDTQSAAMRKVWKSYAVLAGAGMLSLSGCSYDWSTGKANLDGGADADGELAPEHDAGAVDALVSVTPQASDAGASGGPADAHVDGTIDAASLTTEGDATASTDAGASDGSADGAPPDGPAHFWYRDCDTDGFAATKVGRVASLQKPQELADCLGWTEVEPKDYLSTDCDDASAFRHPGADYGLPITRTGAALPPVGDPGYDLNCDGVLEVTQSRQTLGVVEHGALVEIPWCTASQAESGNCFGAHPECIASTHFAGELKGSQYCGFGFLPDSGLVCVSASAKVYWLCR